jgi:small subunit ribosomal protein S18
MRGREGGHGGGGGGGRGGGRDGKKPFKRKFLFRKKKFCKFCDEKIAFIDYKDLRLLQGFTPERSKIFPRRISGTCSKHQRKVMVAIKRARTLALLPFTSD